MPTNRPLRRLEEPDLVYRTEPEKYDAIVADIIEKQAAGRPVLVGTISIEKSERLSTMLRRRGIKHVVLNAKYHAQEAEIVAQAGRKGTVTIATNMAGRGTDILLGGNPEFMARQQCLADAAGREARPRAQERFVDDERERLLLPPRALLPRRGGRTGSASSSTSSVRPTPSTRRSSASAACTSSARSATRRGASTTSCAAAPAARATPARHASTCRSRTT